MSIFPGTFASLPGVSCDRFSGSNANSDQFFLSHCHSDHMAGLDSLVMRLRTPNRVKVNHRIYCSMISKAFIVRKYGFLDEKWVKDLFPNEPVTIHVFDKAGSGSMYQLRVTAIPANHCPGSVMFLYETLDDSGSKVSRRILYTGDFRFEEIDLKTLTSLHQNGNPLPLDEMYLDTTFCHPEYLTFPKREEAKKCIWDIVHGWIKKNGMYRNQRSKHVVLFHLPAQYGSEEILHYIYKRSQSKWRIHVDKSKFGDYLCSDELGDCTDDNPDRAEWIHACSWENSADGKKKKPKKSRQHFLSVIPCQSGKQFEVCQIRPSAMYFDKARLAEISKERTAGEDDANSGVVKNENGNFYRVCYSCHSSLTELMEFVKHFRPKKIVPCVQPRGITLNDVQEVLESALSDGLESVQESAVLTTLIEQASQRREEAAVPDSHEGKSDQWGLKRKVSQSGTSDASRVDGATPVKREFVADVSFDENDEFNSGSAASTKNRRLSFQGSKTSKVSLSLPAARKSQLMTGSRTPHQNRRASLPHSLKIPAIMITPSSPSPDPNHPDYPEFFEDRIYLESLSKCSGGSGDRAASLAAATETDKMELGEEDPVVVVDSAKNKAENSSLEICFENVQKSSKPTAKVFTVPPEVVELSSDLEIEEDTVDNEEELMDSTPELDVIVASAESELVRLNCANYAKSLERKEQRSREEKSFKSSTS